MKKEGLPNIIALAILTLITALFWIIFSVYRIFTTETPPNVPEEILAPITPVLDRETLQRVENSIFIPEDQIPETQALQTPPPEPEPEAPTPEPISTPSESTTSAGGL